jgi:hypothetical protein
MNTALKAKNSEKKVLVVPLWKVDDVKIIVNQGSPWGKLIDGADALDAPDARITLTVDAELQPTHDKAWCFGYHGDKSFLKYRKDLAEGDIVAGVVVSHNTWFKD